MKKNLTVPNTIDRTYSWHANTLKKRPRYHRNRGTQEILDQVLHKENTLSFQPDFPSSVLRKKNLVHIARRLIAKYLLRSLYSEMKLKADMNL